MVSVEKILKVSTPTQHSFSTPDRQSIEAVEDYAVKKVMNTVEGTIEKVPVNDNDIVNKLYADNIAAGLPTNPSISGSLIVAQNIISNGSYVGYGGLLTGITVSTPDLSGSYIPQGQLPVGSIPSLSYSPLTHAHTGSYLPQGILPVGSIPLLGYIPQGQLPTGSLPNTISVSGSVLANYGSFSGRIISSSIGIGTGNPSASLHINGGELYVMNNGNSPRFLFGDSVAAGNYGGLQWNSTNDFISMGTGTGGLDTITVWETGSVGIGTHLVSPVAELEVSGNILGSTLTSLGSIVGLYVSVSGSIESSYGNIPNLLPQGVLPVGSIPSLSSTYIPQGQFVVGSLPTNYVQVGSVTGSFVAAPHAGSHTPSVVNVIYSSVGSPAANTVPEGTIFVMYTA